VNCKPIAASLIVCFLTAALTGCGSHVVPSSGARSPTNAAAVSIYDKEPGKYEDLGTVSVPVGGDVRWDARGDATPGYEKLKAAAAARGANGILLKSTSEDTMLVLAGYRGTFYQVPVRMGDPKMAVVQAIYVLEP
jgi:hypothetical protein